MFTRRHWLGAVVVGGWAALVQLSGLGHATAAKKPLRAVPKRDPKQPYKTRWIGHY